MIKVIVELWPHGHKKGKKTLATMNITNNMTGNKEYGNYNYELKVVRGIPIEDHLVSVELPMYDGEYISITPRSRHIWHLIKGVLNDIKDLGLPEN